MSPRDLPVWARGATALFVLVAAWYVPRVDSLVSLIGGSALEISAGVVAISVLTGMRLPLDLWPQHPTRSHFSLVAALLVGLAMAGLVLASSFTGLPEFVVEFDRGAILALVTGTAMWALAWGQTDQLAYRRWYGRAALAAALPGLVGLVTLTVRDGQLPGLPVVPFLGVAAFFVVAGSVGALVTQELAFRRILIGQAGDAGLATVLLAAVVFGLWHALAPDPPGGFVGTFAAGALNGTVMGSLYLLTRSLMIPAFYHGVSNATIRGIELTASAPEGMAPYEGTLSLAVAITTAVIAVWFAYKVNRRSGFLGVLRRREVIDAPGD